MHRPVPRSRATAAVLLVAVALLLVGGVLAATSLQADQRPGDEVLDRVAERYDSAETVVGTATVVVANDTHERAASVEYAVAEPNLSRVTVTRDGRTVDAGTDGSVAWVAGANRTVLRELPADDEAPPWPATEGLGPDDAGHGSGIGPGSDTGPGPNATPARDGAAHPVPGPNGTLHPANVTATVTGTETVDGREAHVVSLDPPERTETDWSGTLWVATEDARVLRATATDGTNRTEVRFERTRFDVSVHDSEFDPPGDRAAVTSMEQYDDRSALRAATDLDLPVLEDGRFADARRVARPAGEAVLQRYRTDAGNVTLVTATGETGVADRFENGTSASVDDRNATAIGLDDRTAVVWTEAGVTTAVVVDGPTADAVAVAEAL